MKFSFSLLAILLFFSACSPKVTLLETSEVTYLSSPNEGTVALQSIGYGKTVPDAEIDGIERAFNTIFFVGIPNNSALKSPMVADRSAVESKNPQFFKEFFAKKKYAPFITNQQDAADISKIQNPRVYKLTKGITINYVALRKHLEETGGTRKFGL